MMFAGERYYRINRIMLTAVGLWPYHKPSIFRTTLIFCMLLSFIVFQFTTFMTRTCDFNFVIKELTYILPTIADFSMYNLFFFNSEVIKQLCEHIKTDWNTMEHDSEIKILKKYALESYVLTQILVFLGSFCLCALVFIELLPFILDFVYPLKVSQLRTIIMEFELFIDQVEYFYVYLLHEIISLLIGFFTLAATGTLLVAFMRHCCATFKIASNIIENIVTKDTIQIPPHQKVRVMYQKISRAVRIHRNSIQFITFLMDAVNIWFFVLMGIIVLSLSCSLFRFFNAIALPMEFNELGMCSVIVITHFIIIFIGNFIGQSIIDHSEEMFRAAYNTTWYAAPLQIQKLLLFVMQYTLKTRTVQLGGIFVASLEGFSTLITTSVSYFTVLYKMI